MITYDEDIQLTSYIYDFYRHAYMSKFELMMANCFAKMEMKEQTIERSGYCLTDPKVQAALSQGFTALQKQVVARILAEHANEIFINRCGMCKRILATPKAKQCLWCGYDWH